ncbi:asparagine synthase (glutamine-hydrolyzing) [Belliella aquatica]|uniref:asparagine synthase (glutamine-hydrolyzing) n=1 Tax=Belliella aquatica TaxID=1323734 RepID=A0ABQ1N4S3_9BACT|nr:asparagine synthase (glutamine-hydrolyzing) [Belliella aquatica]MCH7404605.1 asparagine synthase (glutamine-hydrolyzing) [Belliella aquatica]GGC53650.1 asparagine synthetase B [Belliella aquatica]
MCGINGFIVLEDDLPDEKKLDLRVDLREMNALIAHRGPDSDGFFIKDHVGLGFRRLSIIDLSIEADQPMVNNDLGLAIIFNGEIYNYLEIKEALLQKGYSFKTESDTEVILNAYKAYGAECVKHFNGMWAFVIYDFHSKKIFCSRDRFGVKPFYYCIQDDVLFFSSELKALHAVCNLKNANHAKVYEYLAYGYRVNDGETFFENCFELLPGNNLIVLNGKIDIQRYWELRENQYQHNPNITLEQEYSALFEDAVKIRFRSDVPVGILLSGGLDSTAITKVTDRLIGSGALDQKVTQAYIASFPNFEDDETTIAKEFIKTCDHIQLKEMMIEKKELVVDFEKKLAELDHPLGSFASLAHNNIMNMCKKEGVKVVLNGQGSDEAYAGYIQYISGIFLISVLMNSPKAFLKEYRALRDVNGYSRGFLFSQMFKALINQSRASFLRAKYQEKSIEVLDRGFVKINKKHFKNSYSFSLKEDSFNKYLLHQINHQGINTILHYEDISSMNKSIEIRSPFMDYRLMEFAFSIPSAYKFSEGVTKVIQRNTIGKDLPKSITENRKKIGFKTPFLDYLKSDEGFRKMIFEILDRESFTRRKIWHAAEIRQRFEDVGKNKEFPYWRIINLEIWASAYGIQNL